MTDVVEVVITAPEPDWLAAFARRMVENRLAAGAHEIVMIRSIYRWRDKIYDKLEARVALHTRDNLVDEIVHQVNETHPYEVPCVISLPVVNGNAAYIEWVIESTTDGIRDRN